MRFRFSLEVFALATFWGERRTKVRVGFMDDTPLRFVLIGHMAMTHTGIPEP